MSGLTADKAEVGRPRVPSERPPFYLRRRITFPEIRRFVREAHARGLAVLIGLLYVLGAVFLGGMVVFAHFSGDYTSEIILYNPTGQQWWNYPGLLVIAPWGAITLPFFPTVVMLVVGAGVGLGMTVALLLTLRLLRPSPQEKARSKALGAISGLTPAMLSLVTLGACCTTTAAATAGIGLVADVSATSVSSLLLNNWYLGVFQIAVVLASLYAQELLLSVYGGLYGRGRGAVLASQAPPEPRRPVSVGALRIVLLVAGLLWTLEVLADWTVNAPANAGAGRWASWLLQHGLVGFVAIALGLFPRGTFRAMLDRRGAVLWRGLLGLAGASMLAWVPSSLASAGFYGLPNELFGAAGLGGPWAGVPLPVGAGWALAFRWVGEFGTLGIVALLLAISPGRLRAFVESGIAAPVRSDQVATVDPSVPAETPGGAYSLRAPDLPPAPVADVDGS